MFWNIGITQKNESRLFLLVTVMLSAMILPSFPIHPSLPNIRLDELLLFFIFGLNVLSFIFHKFRFDEQNKQALREQKKELKIIFVIFGLLVISYAISNFYGVYIRRAGYYGLRDVMELITYFKYFLVITLTLSVKLNKDELGFFSKAFVSGLLFLIVFGWLQHINPLNLNTWLSPYFNQSHWDTLIVGNPVRVLGTLDNPNYFGVLTVICLSFLTMRYYFGDHRDKFPWLLFILIGLVIKLEMLTISRTAFLGIGLLFLIISVWAFFYHGRNKNVIIKVAALFLLTVLLFFTASADFFYRFNEGLDFSTSTSMQVRVQQWGNAVGSIWESPVLGWGTQKEAMTTVVDDEFILLTRRYGFVGLAVYLSFYLLPLIKGIRYLLLRSRLRGRGAVFSEKSQFIGAYIALLPCIFVFNIMATTFYNLQIMTIFVIAMGLVYNAFRDEKQDNCALKA
ncbi:O-antigen ligase family protein [Dehalobacter sp. DCM]|uniref:O-antigen ligase family protein n=1 Tax=Dehalobacter sp. DCM TaxID=2907827 RepID=UPI0030814F3B|nr:O-antigen ligase family protein [Dehalobacter sp. DCM]